MIELVIQVTTTIISGCIVAIFAQWLRNRNDRKK
ncbi:type I toxin-antitoxin system Fst family toxin [Staphylococcus pettenkoferi]|uniref:Type I toxin-antitoxin system Fst family toxin n=1 Tax=Staphylococcus pettenkoferi TaxID=170573 RepID=A0A9Q4D3S9_9STAP|nr:type I toxin-antitoxin system Fst family toxin [Staphylococcus pettenkoferi]MCY1569674.1 type I toxin-antitoxin system Fst family toxin [Staphylococcus pettenkoferi]MCY1576058.1 type I toxin-antitoxin system Fst family toxin [Staphylococcus pettenkoferi]MCY1594153.1 type I toxin-antitoxin system Fst family toxin [Staphylococcus pettenkoferi]MCY1617673.1 type I toxin-antitoxin system Fst family toxin [Staphylococcus pettenkoferi]